MTLTEFAEIYHFEEKLRKLAEEQAMKGEPWQFSEEHSNYDPRPYAILRRYLDYTFKKIYAENKIVYTPSRRYAAFNTGLVSDELEDIYGFFEKHRDRESYILKGFFFESDSAIAVNFSRDLPDTANYFTNPSDLLFNPKNKLLVRYNHILQDNRARWIQKLGHMSPSELRQTLYGAIEEVKKLVRNNYKIAIPQIRWSENPRENERIQLLLPLKIERNNQSDLLALVVDKVGSSNELETEEGETEDFFDIPEQETVYIGITCFTLPMAYSNARLIVRPSSDWLRP